MTIFSKPLRHNGLTAFNFFSKIKINKKKEVGIMKWLIDLEKRDEERNSRCFEAVFPDDMSEEDIKAHFEKKGNKVESIVPSAKMDKLFFDMDVRHEYYGGID